MAEVKIDIPGIGEVVATNAASESTLRELLKAMGGKVGPGQQGSGSGTGGSKSSDDLDKNLKKANKGLLAFTESLGRATQGLMNLFSSVIGATIGSAVNLSKELLVGGSQLSDFTRHLPIGPLQGLVEAVDSQVDSFRMLSSTGATFGNDMFELQRVAGQSAIPIADMTSLIQENGMALKLFGSTVGSGTRNFGRISKEFRQSTVGRDLMAMGFSTQELNENLLAYSETMQTTGNRERLSTQQLLAGTAAYSKQLDAVAKLTGKSRKQLEEEMRQKNMDIRVQLAQSNMTTEEVAKFGSNLRLAGAHSQSFEAALVDMADGLENDPVTRQLANMSTTFRENAKNIKNMSAQEFNAFTAQVRKEGLEYAKRFGKDGEGVQAMISGGTDLGNAFQTIGELGKVAEGTPGTVEKEQTARDKATTAMTTLAESINEIRGAIVNDLLGSQIFKDLKNGLADFVPSLETVKSTYQELKAQFMTHLKPSIDEFVAYLKGPGMEDLKELISNIQQMASEYLPKIKDFFARLLDDPKKVFTDEILPVLKEGISAMASNILTSDFGLTLGGLLLAGIVGLNPFGMVGSLIVAGLISYIGWDNIKTFFAEAFEDFSLKDTATEVWQGIKDWFSGIWDFSEVKTDIKQLVTDAWTTIKEWFGSLWDKLFDFKIELPNFRQYLPKWMGGEGKSLFGGDSDDTTSSSSPSSSSVESEPEQISSNPNDAFSGMEYQLSQLNTKLEELKTLTSRNTTAVKALNGNIQIG